MRLRLVPCPLANGVYAISLDRPLSPEEQLHLINLGQRILHVSSKFKIKEIPEAVVSAFK